MAATKTGKIINVKKGQFLAPWDIKKCHKKNRKFRKQKYSCNRGSEFWIQHPCF